MSVRRHTSYNIVGAVIPILLSLVTIPVYLKLVGAERYGVLSIAWLLLGYFGLFDLGLGRAVSFRIAALREGSAQDRADAYWAAIAVNAAMGVVGALILWGASVVFYTQAKLDDQLRAEAMASLPLLAASLPIATISGVMGGALQGRERFLGMNVVSVISTALFQLFPLLIAWKFGPNLVLLMAGAIAARLIAMIALGVLCRRELGGGVKRRLARAEVPLLLKYGGWVTLTSLFGPVLVFLDRFVIGALLGAAPVAVYSIAYQLAKQIGVVPTSMSAALFPKMSSSAAEERNATTSQANLTLACLLSLPVLGATFLIQPFMELWVGHEMALQAAPVGRLLMIAFWINAFAMMAYTNLQAAGRPDLVTKMLIAEIPFYLVGLYLGMHYFGLPGSALAFAARCALDYVLLTWVAGKNFDAWPILAVNGVLLSLGIVAAGIWTIAQWQWWATFGGLALVIGVVGLLSLPPSVREELARQLRRLQFRNAS